MIRAAAEALGAIVCHCRSRGRRSRRRGGLTAKDGSPLAVRREAQITDQTGEGRDHAPRLDGCINLANGR
jgi:hypothetical protein